VQRFIIILIQGLSREQGIEYLIIQRVITRIKESLLV
jgi:hypothetical protein